MGMHIGTAFQFHAFVLCGVINAFMGVDLFTTRIRNHPVKHPFLSTVFFRRCTGNDRHKAGAARIIFKEVMAVTQEVRLSIVL